MACTDKPSEYNACPADVTESWCLETREGLFFAVKGLEHPPDRWIAVLRYAPDPEKGSRMKDGVLYRRLYHFGEQDRLIRQRFPQYLAFDPVFQAALQSVPRSAVVRAYDPRRRFRELALASSLPPIEADARALLLLLQKEAQVPPSALGITGSLLTGLHVESSDLDIAAFGEANCRKVYRALRRLLDAQSGAELRPLGPRDVDELYEQRVVDTHMPFDEFARLEKRKVNQGRFRDRIYFIRFIKDTQEAGAVYGNVRYTPLGPASIAATVADDRGALFTPCSYPVSDVRILDGPPVSELNEVVSFRGRFCEQARSGESVLARGALERLETSQGEIRHRLLLGNCPEDTLGSARA